MSRHRRRPLPEITYRTVANPSIPVVIHEQDDGSLIVDVDEQLHGHERTKAVMDVLRPWLRGDLGMTPVALIVAGWAAATRWPSEHQRVATAIASAATTAAVCAIALAIIVGEPDDRPPPEALPAVMSAMTVTVEPTASSLAPPPTSHTTTNAAPTPSRTPEAEPVREPAGHGPTPQARRTMDPPARTRQPVSTGSASPSATPAKTKAATTRPTIEAVDEQVRSSTPREQPQQTPTVERPASTAPQPIPAPTAATAGCGGVLHVAIDPLADICLL